MSKKSIKKAVYIKTFGWPYVQVRRDDFGAVEEDKCFGVKELSQNKTQFS